jgi:hypothetical protein
VAQNDRVVHVTGPFSCFCGKWQSVPLLTPCE